MHLKTGFAALAITAFALAAPRAANADGLVTGFVGTTFSGSAESSELVFGGSIGAVNASGLGFEFDLGYSPDFFGTEDIDGTKLNVTTAMGNIMFGPAMGSGVRPYVTGGFGLLRTSISDPLELIEDVSKNDFGLNAGGGLILSFGTFGIRGDLRYFRSLQDDDDDLIGFALSNFDFWRGTVGATFRF